MLTGEPKLARLIMADHDDVRLGSSLSQLSESPFRHHAMQVESTVGILAQLIGPNKGSLFFFVGKESVSSVVLQTVGRKRVE